MLMAQACIVLRFYILSIAPWS
ncbi:hypothetical protein F383_29014 [Gossypium arboreum]|uniref:Uncharacterized protein n=1 Tax=Gossypium arboreum TaxID=29729 RepID=A0A0B0MQA5_GOSAR|nr:hypothetical protein F383_29014 [Gossypium arboreum]